MLWSSRITQKGVTNIAELESNFKMDQVEQKLPDMYCQHQNPDGVLNIGYTRIGLQFSSAFADWINFYCLTTIGNRLSSILWLMAMVSGTVLHATSLIYYAFGESTFLFNSCFWTSLSKGRVCHNCQADTGLKMSPFMEKRGFKMSFQFYFQMVSCVVKDWRRSRNSFSLV